MVVLLCKAGFSPDLESTRMWDASLKRQTNPPSASAVFEASGCRCLVFLVLAPACTAVRFGLLLSTLSRLTHILYAVLDGSNFRGTSTRFSKGMIKSRTEASRMVRGGKRSSVRGALTRAPLSPRCTALSVASCGNHGAAPNSGTRVPGNLGGKEPNFKKEI